jgi:hypothetical protein
MKCRIQLRSMGRVLLSAKSISSSNELFPSPSTCRDWHNHNEKYNELKIDTTHFYTVSSLLLSSICNINVSSDGIVHYAYFRVNSIESLRKSPRVEINPSTVNFLK